MVILEQNRARIICTGKDGLIYTHPSQGEIDIRYEYSDGGYVSLARVSSVAQAGEVMHTMLKTARNDNGYVDMNEVMRRLGC